MEHKFIICHIHLIYNLYNRECVILSFKINEYVKERKKENRVWMDNKCERKAI